jgi:plasmid maintenance system antidote protein VapI
MLFITTRVIALSRFLNGEAGISADMALRFSDAFGTSPARQDLEMHQRNGPRCLAKGR